MSTTVRILLAADESENSHCVVKYVGSLLGRTPDVVVTLFHVLKLMPRGLLAHGGSENPAFETQLSAKLRDEQEAWIWKEREFECHILKQARETLAQSWFDMSHVAMRMVMKTISPEIFPKRRVADVTKPSSWGGRGRPGSNRASAAA